MSAARCMPVRARCMPVRARCMPGDGESFIGRAFRRRTWRCPSGRAAERSECVSPASMSPSSPCPATRAAQQCRHMGWKQSRCFIFFDFFRFLSIFFRFFPISPDFFPIFADFPPIFSRFSPDFFRFPPIFFRFFPDFSPIIFDLIDFFDVVDFLRSFPIV